MYVHNTPYQTTVCVDVVHRYDTDPKAVVHNNFTQSQWRRVSHHRSYRIHS